jgi:hypothetical protein
MITVWANIPLRAHFVADAKRYADAKPEPYESTNVSIYIATSLDGSIASRSLDTHHFSVCRGMGVFTFFTYFLKLAVL